MNAEFSGLGEKRVIDVGDIAHALDGVTAIDKPSLQNVITDERECMTNMSRVIRRDATCIHQHFSICDEIYNTLFCGVVKLQCQVVPPRSGMPVSLGATLVL